VKRPADGINHGKLAEACRSRAGGAAIPGRHRQRCEPHAIALPLDPRPFDLVAAERKLEPGEVKSACPSAARTISRDHPDLRTTHRARGYSSMLVRPPRWTLPNPSRRPDQHLASRGRPQIPSHATSSTHLWFTIATPPITAGPRRDAGAAGSHRAESIRPAANRSTSSRSTETSRVRRHRGAGGGRRGGPPRATRAPSPPYRRDPTSQ